MTLSWRIKLVTLLFYPFWGYSKDSENYILPTPPMTSSSFRLSLPSLWLCHDNFHKTHRNLSILPEFSSNFQLFQTWRFRKSIMWSPWANRHISMATTRGSAAVVTVASIYLSILQVPSVTWYLLDCTLTLAPISWRISSSRDIIFWGSSFELNRVNCRVFSRLFLSMRVRSRATDMLMRSNAFVLKKLINVPFTSHILSPFTFGRSSASSSSERIAFRSLTRHKSWHDNLPNKTEPATLESSEVMGWKALHNLYIESNLFFNFLHLKPIVFCYLR